MGSSQSKAPPVSRPSPLLEQPWREVSEKYKDILKFVKSYQPENEQVKHLRILLYGPVGSGKSSFINSVDSVLKGRPAGRAQTDAPSGKSFTRQYQTFKFHKSPGAKYSFVFNDIMGFEQTSVPGISVNDLKLALRGHVKEGYKFNPDKELKKGDDGYNSDPTLEDKVHVLVGVVAADSVSMISDEMMKRIREVRLAASELGIPQMAILTKVDVACPEVKRNTSNIYKSKYLEEKVERFQYQLGVPMNCIFLLKNYSHETESNDEVNAAIVCALKQMVMNGEDFLNDQIDDETQGLTGPVHHKAMGGDPPAWQPPRPVTPPPPLLEQPWRKVSEKYKENLEFVKSYQPENEQVKHLRILLHGPIGAGKSSFINSVDTVLKGRLSGRAQTDAHQGGSYTKQYRTFKFPKSPGAKYSFVFNDIMGFEQDFDSGINVNDLKLALRGNVKDGYEFNPDQVLMRGDDGFNSDPTLEDKVHVLVGVVPADAVGLLSDEMVKKIRKVRLAASELGIPQLAILTKVDEACPEVAKDTSNIYKSKYLKEKVEQFHQLLGLPKNCIFLVKNYDDVIESNDKINPAIVCALKQMVMYGEDFLNDQ